MSEPLYDSNDYKSFLRHKIFENRSVRGYKTRLARAAGCQKSFLSQVLNSHVHLTPDHAAGLCRLWKLEADEASYFLDLVAYARAATPALKGFIEQRLQQVRQQHKQVASRYANSKQLPLENLAEYYTSWHVAAVHVLMSVPGYSRSDALARRLKLSQESVNSTLKLLERMKLAQEQKNGEWKVLQHDLFLPRASPLVKSYHTAWRHKAAVQLQNEEPDALHFTTLYALSRADAMKIRNMVLEMIESTRKVMLPSKEEEMICLCCDLFRVE
jgi:uncharacterized protein (TIGR02147 family)